MSLRFFLEFAYVSFDPGFGGVVVGKLFLVSFERGGVVVAAAVYVAGRVGDVEHFVEDDVLDDVSRDVSRVERSADRDVVVRRVVVAEDAVSLFG